MMRPLVTICIPTYRRLEYLKEAVSSALQQDYPRFEIIIGDDGTTQELREWCQEQTKQNPRVRYQHNGRNLGLAGNWNALADAAEGEYVAIIGDDDRLLPEFISRLIDSVGSADVAFSNHYLIDAVGRRLGDETRRITARYSRHLLVRGELEQPICAVWRNSVPMSASLIRTEVVRRLRFKEDLNTPELELFVRLAGSGGRFVFVPEYLSEYRVHAASETSHGLMGDRLVRYLEPVIVPPDVEPLKAALLAEMLAGAVGSALGRGDKRVARQFLRSRYYKSGPLMSTLHRVCIGFPPAGVLTFRHLRLVRNWIAARLPLRRDILT
jgi:glycosyltransferase involved in cell wall biosynthesis